MRPRRLQNRFQEASGRPLAAHPATNDFGVAPGGSWASPGALLGLSRTALDTSWVAFGVPGGAPGVVLGAFCASFEGFERKS